MKKGIVLIAAFCAFVACKNGEVKTENELKKAAHTEMAAVANVYKDYTGYGGKVAADKVLSPEAMSAQYANMKAGDTLDMTFKAPINSVCTKKGCWMRLNAGEENEIFVKFKDYGFFVPLDATGEAVVQGKAFIEEVAVAELRHMAEDAGKSKEEIAAITTPQKELRFLADGVLIGKSK